MRAYMCGVLGGRGHVLPSALQRFSSVAASGAAIGLASPEASKAARARRAAVNFIVFGSGVWGLV